MMYRFNKQTLLWEYNKVKLTIILFVCLSLILGSFLIGRHSYSDSLTNYEKELIVLSLEQEKNKFTQEKFVEELKKLNIEYPHIVLAQSIIETGHWSSKIFKESNNLFGMKEAKYRITTAKGTQYNHAYYHTWYESVYDYAFYSCKYLSNIRSEEEYFMYLERNYAEDTSYVQKLKSLIERENLKDLF